MIVILNYSYSYSQDCNNKIIIGERFKIHSSVYNKERTITVGLPRNYNPRKKYPVLYMLDGLAQYSIGAIYSGLNYVGTIPDLIIVAIDYENRNNEYTPTHIEKIKDSGGSGQFVDFMEKDLFPYIDSVYSTMPYRIITGHSYAGILVVDLLLSKPNLFNAYIAMDPSLDWDNCFEMKKTTICKNENLKYKNVYISGIKDNKNAFIFDSTLNSKNIPNFKCKYQYFEDEVHADVVFVSLYYGLRNIFSDYSVTSAIRDSITMGRTPEIIKTHYLKFSKETGVQFLPPEDFIIRLGLQSLYYDIDVPNAIKIFEILKEYYPESCDLYKDLGESYFNNGDKQSALINYRKSFKINPKDEVLKNKISDLENKK